MSDSVSNTPPETTSATASSMAKLSKALSAEIAASMLPGDTPLSDETIAQTAQFLVSAGYTREVGEPALLVESTTTGRRRLRVAVINDDMPFLVDSLAAAVTALGMSIDVLVHPLVPVERDDAGLLTAIGGDSAARESMIYIETPRADARQRRELIAQLRIALADVRAAVNDWRAIQTIMQEDAALLQEADGPHAMEEAALLRWLNHGMLTQLGHVTRSRDGQLSDVLGICRESARDLLADGSYERAFAWFEDSDADGQPRTLLILKANRLSNVHRRTALDLFIVPHRDEAGRVNALSVHAGVWTSAALATAPDEVPVLRARLKEISEGFGFAPTSHTGKALIHAFTTLPHDLLVGFSVPDTRVLTTAMMSLVDRPRPRLILVNSPLERHIYAFVWLPRDRMSTGVRLEIQDLLLQIPGTKVLDWSLAVEGGALA
ncbi:MAG: glutamate dehydrogenase, partial [Pseudomonadota bacterium]